MSDLSDASGLWILLVLAILAGSRVLVDRLDRRRIRVAIKRLGGEVMDIRWSLLGSYRHARFGDSGERFYEVTYRSNTNEIVRSVCKTRALTGVWWSGEVLQGGFRPMPRGETECPKCGHANLLRQDRCGHCGWEFATPPEPPGA